MLPPKTGERDTYLLRNELLINGSNGCKEILTLAINGGVKSHFDYFVHS